MKPQNQRLNGRRVIGFLFALMFSSTAVAAVIAYYNPQIFVPCEDDRTWITTTYTVHEHVTGTSVNGINTQTGVSSVEYTMYRDGKLGLDTDFGEHGEGNAEIEIEMDMADISKVVLYTSSADILIESSSDSEKLHPILKIEGDEMTQYNYTKFHHEFSVAVHPYSGGSGRSDRQVTLILPPSYKGKVEIQNKEGNVKVLGGFQSVTAKVETGNTAIGGEIGEIQVDSGVGNVEMDVLAAEVIKAQVNTGNIRFDGSVESGKFDCETGNVELSLSKLSEGTIEIDCRLGSVQIQMPKNDDTYISANIDQGTIDIFKEAQDDKAVRYGSKHASSKCFIKVNTGSITVK